jgi:hypothetical protein
MLRKGGRGAYPQFGGQEEVLVSYLSEDWGRCPGPLFSKRTGEEVLGHILCIEDK